MFLKKNQTNHTFKYFCQPCDTSYSSQYFPLYSYLFFLQLLSFIFYYYHLTVSVFSLLQMVRTCWLYYFSKFIELLDTVSICNIIKEVVMFPFHSRRTSAVEAGGIYCYLFSLPVFNYWNTIKVFTLIISSSHFIVPLHCCSLIIRKNVNKGTHTFKNLGSPDNLSNG